MKAPVLAGALFGAVAGFGAGILARPSGHDGPPPGPDPVIAEQRSRIDTLQARLDEAKRRSVPPPDPPPAPVAAPAAAPVPDPAVVRINDALGQRNQEQAAEISALKAEIGRLQATLPEPQVLKDLRAAPLDDLVLLATALRKEVQGRLLSPSESLAARFSSFLQRPQSGTARILPRGKYTQVVEKREGGAYWSFATRDNDYNKEPDLGLEGPNFKSGFYGSARGYFLPLGDLDVDLVGSDPSPPPGLDADQRERWEFLWSESPFLGKESWRKAMAPYNEFQERARKLGLEGSVPAGVGHTYLLRSMLPGEHEVLVLFRVADADDTGFNLVWQVLKNWNIPRQR